MVESECRTHLVTVGRRATVLVQHSGGVRRPLLVLQSSTVQSYCAAARPCAIRCRGCDARLHPTHTHTHVNVFENGDGAL